MSDLAYQTFATQLGDLEAGMAGHRRRPEPYTRLAMAVVLQAFKDIVSPDYGTREEPTDATKTRTDAWIWVFSDGYEELSFRWYCDHLGINHEWARNKVANPEFHAAFLREYADYLKACAR